MILALDASSARGHAALVADGHAVAEAIFSTGPQHGGEMYAALQRLWPLADGLREIRVGLGPGSYAGVRMAIAALTGLALARDVPLLGLPSVCACSAAPRYCAVGDARRGGFYFSRIEHGRVVEGPRIVDRPTLDAFLAQHAGDPVFAAEESLRRTLPQAEPSLPSAVRLAALPVESPARPLEPIYLRDPHITVAKPVVPPPAAPAKPLR
ncbi:MAG: tRNA (adenosine(37)-N6)-threonylcarbamoyltransferase complex dimerization subunit type 1 TsaB [Verrucomicrobia bacterium]|nr:tRNA (adenosine(37)-N6)-threonylcarbamoyltransferase complex dimerization subunit type 1 TsaB [Verrucomicrobiota bacterium]